MSYVIRTEAEHRAAKDRRAALDAERYDSLRGDDSALSDWASSVNHRFDELALEVIENGGFIECLQLCDAEGVVVSDRLVEGEFGRSWRLDDEAAERFGRRFIPFNNGRGTSRVQKSLGLAEVNFILPASRFVRSYSSGFMSVEFEVVPARSLDELVPCLAERFGEVVA